MPSGPRWKAGDRPFLSDRAEPAAPRSFRELPGARRARRRVAAAMGLRILATRSRVSRESRVSRSPTLAVARHEWLRRYRAMTRLLQDCGALPAGDRASRIPGVRSKAGRDTRSDPESPCRRAQ